MSLAVDAEAMLSNQRRASPRNIDSVARTPSPADSMNAGRRVPSGAGVSPFSSGASSQTNPPIWSGWSGGPQTYVRGSETAMKASTSPAAAIARSATAKSQMSCWTGHGPSGTGPGQVGSSGGTSPGAGSVVAVDASDWGSFRSADLRALMMPTPIASTTMTASPAPTIALAAG